MAVRKVGILRLTNNFSTAILNLEAIDGWRLNSRHTHKTCRRRLGKTDRLSPPPWIWFE